MEPIGEVAIIDTTSLEPMNMSVSHATAVAVTTVAATMPPSRNRHRNEKQNTSHYEKD